MFRVVVIAVAVLLTQACNIKVDSPQVKIDPNITASGDLSSTDNYVPVTCAAGLPSDMGGVVESGVAAPILIQAIDGVSPYKVFSKPGTFNSQTTVSRTYSNSGTTNLIVTDTVQVIDSKGHTAQCQFNVTVLPATNPSNLACTLDASPSNPQILQNVAFDVNGSGGTLPYTFSTLTLGSGGVTTSQLSKISVSEAVAAGYYNAPAGMRTASVRVTDATGNSVVCSKSIQVRNNPSVAVSASPSTSVTYTTPVTLTATANDFSGVPTFTFSTTESGISITSTNNIAVIRVTDGLNHSSVPVTVRAVAGTESATTSTTLSFTGSMPMTCSVTHTPSSVGVNANVTFSVTASTGEAVTITEFNYGNSGSVVSQTASSRTLKYVTGGTKTVSLRASSVSRPSVSCNAGALLSDSVVVTTPFTCDAYTVYNPSYENEYFVAYAVLKGDVGYTWLESIRARPVNSSVWFTPTIYSWYDNLSAYLNFPLSGGYVLELKVRDVQNRTATCTTQHNVVRWW